MGKMVKILPVFLALLRPNGFIFSTFLNGAEDILPVRFWKCFHFGPSSYRTLARAVWSLGDNGVTNHYHHHRQCHQLQTALARATTKTETFLESPGQNLYRTVEKGRKSQTVWSQQMQSSKKMPHFDHFPRPGEINWPIWVSFCRAGKMAV